MAGIEKVCEFSGVYKGADMYKWKRNHIQIMPEYRKLFRGSKAILIFQRYDKISKDYTYYLLVPEPHLQGEVKGKYLNWTYRPKTALRKMRRLTRNYKLQIKWSK